MTATGAAGCVGRGQRDLDAGSGGGGCGEHGDYGDDSSWKIEGWGEQRLTEKLVEGFMKPEGSRGSGSTARSWRLCVGRSPMASAGGGLETSRGA